MSLTTDPQKILSNIHTLATAVSNIHPDLEASVLDNVDNKRAASLVITDNGIENSPTTEFSVVGSRFVYSLEALDENGDQQIKLPSGYSEKDVETAACQLAHKAGFDFD